MHQPTLFPLAQDVVALAQDAVALQQLVDELRNAQRPSCKYAHLSPSRAHGLGCGCTDCVAYARAYARLLRKTSKGICSYAGCTNPKRSGMGVRYCDHHGDAVNRGALPQQHRGSFRSTCDICLEVAPVNRGFYNVCVPCRLKHGNLIGSARKHRASAALVRSWIKSPFCELCLVSRRNVDAPLERLDGWKQNRFHIDHDHSCCPGKDSCGKCIRGILCPRHNMQLGTVERIASEMDLRIVMGYMRQLQTQLRAVS